MISLCFICAWISARETKQKIQGLGPPMFKETKVISRVKHLHHNDSDSGPQCKENTSLLLSIIHLCNLCLCMQVLVSVREIVDLCSVYVSEIQVNLASNFTSIYILKPDKDCV